MVEDESTRATGLAPRTCRVASARGGDQHRPSAARAGRTLDCWRPDQRFDDQPEGAEIVTLTVASAAELPPRIVGWRSHRTTVEVEILRIEVAAEPCGP